MNLTNCFLIANPSLQHLIYRNSVVYVVEHSVTHGATGVIINKPVTEIFNKYKKTIDLSEDFSKKWANGFIYFGGISDFHEGFVLRKVNSATKPYELTNDKSAILEMLLDHHLHDTGIFITSGYTSWEPGVLEQELCDSYWLTLTDTSRLIFQVQAQERYNEALRAIGITDACKMDFTTQMVMH